MGDEVRAGTVDLADETCDGAGRRERDEQMDVIGDATERQGLASERDSFGLDCAIGVGLDCRTDQWHAFPR